jgi:MFS family permease
LKHGIFHAERAPDSQDKFSYGTVLFLLSACILLPMISESMLVAALPGIELEFSTQGIIGAWILPVVLLLGASLCPFLGTLGDNHGRKKILSIGLAFYVAGVLLSGFSWNIWSLLLFRAMQGIGIAASPIAFAIVSEHFPPERVSTGIGILAGCYGAGTLLGIFFGSIVTGILGWRWTYYILIPVVILHLVLVNLKIPSSPGTPGRRSDWAGAFLLLAAIFFLMTAVTLCYGGEFEPVPVAVSVALSVIAAVLFVYCEKKSAFPSIDLRMLKKRKVAIIAAMALLLNMTTFLYVQVFPFIIQSPAGLMLGELFVGCIMVPGSIADMIMSTSAGVWVRRKGHKPVFYLGGILIIIAPLVYFLLPLSVITLAAVYTIFCAGMGMISTAYLIVMIGTVPPDRTAGATGLLNSYTNIGGMIGPIITGIFLATFSVKSVVDGVSWQTPTAEAFFYTFATGMAAALVIMMLIIAINNGRKVQL